MTGSADIGFVVIGRNEGERLVRCLDAITELAPGLPLVYVDSGSTDGSTAAATERGATVVELDTSIPLSAARARNEGFAALRESHPDAGFVQFMDGDCELAPGWIDRAREAFAASDDLGVVCGLLRERHPEASVYNRLCDIEWNAALGEVRSVGGNAAYRVEPFGAVGGFDSDVVAGEEPELCYRLRHKGWRVLRLDAPMATHDAAMTRFGQWWKRSERAGLAAAQGAWLHGRGPERFNVRRVASNVAWGLILPFLAILLAVPTRGLSIVAVAALFALMAARVWIGARRSHGAKPGLALYGLFTAIGKIPQALGAVRFAWRRLIGAAPRVVEYKDAANSGARSVVYVASYLPRRSETFVYREILGLRDAGWRITPVSLHEPDRDLGDPTVDELADQAMPIYAAGAASLARAVLAELVTHPIRSLSTLFTAAADALGPEPRTPTERAKICLQGAASLRLARVAREAGATHIHAHFAHVPATFAMYAARQLHIPFSFTGHANDLFANRSLLVAKLRRAAFVACISEWHREHYRSVLPTISDDRLVVIRCGVDTDKFTPRDDEANSLPARVVAVARCVRKKGLDILIEAVANLRAHDANVTAVIVGDGPELENLRRLAVERGVADHVRFTAALPNHMVRAELAEADVFCLPCRVDEAGDRDGIPVVLMEAMACGVPVVAGDLPAIRELVEDTVTGRLVPADDPATLAEVLASFLEDRPSATALGRAGRRRVVEEFGLRPNVDRLIAAFESASGAAISGTPPRNTTGERA